jgi:hypothetical protein
MDAVKFIMYSPNCIRAWRICLFPICHQDDNCLSFPWNKPENASLRIIDNWSLCNFLLQPRLWDKFFLPDLHL